MSEFGPYNEDTYESYNGPFYYNFVITDSKNIEHTLTPVDTYTFLTQTNEFLPSIKVFRTNELLISLSPEYGTRNYVDSILGLRVRPEPYFIFQYVFEVERREERGGTFKDEYELEYAQRKEAGEQVFNPFSRNNTNMNWKSVARRRKNTIKSQLPRNYNKQFQNIKQKGPYGKWHGASPMRSRKTRKNRR